MNEIKLVKTKALPFVILVILNNLQVFVKINWENNQHNRLDENYQNLSLIQTC